MANLLTIALLPFVFAGVTSFAQEPPVSCPALIEYGNRNQVDPKPLTVSDVSGVVLFQRGKLSEEVEDVGPINDACVGLFTEKGHRLVASAKAVDDGRFRLKAVPAGLYRLVVRDPHGLLCVANVPLKITARTRGRMSVGGPLVVHMRSSAIDDCSYGDFK
jgi:hypothetical protein